MSTTQDCHKINYFFNVNTTITEFVKKFDQELARRVEAEDDATFSCKNRKIHCGYEFSIEGIFYKLYTDTKFRDLQTQLNHVSYQDAKRDTTEGEVVVYKVTDKLRACTWFRPSGMVFDVTFDRASKKINCMCKEFEFNGILCRHIVKVLWLEGEDWKVHDMYVLDRWRINIARNYQKYTIAHYNPLLLRPEPRVYSMMHEKFQEVAHMLVGNDALTTEFMNTLSKLKGTANEAQDKAHGLHIGAAVGGGRIYLRNPPNEEGDPASGNPEGQTSNSHHDPTTPSKVPPTGRKKRGRPKKTQQAIPNNVSVKKNKGERAPSANDQPVPPVPKASHNNVIMGKKKAKRARTAKNPPLPHGPMDVHTSPPQPVHPEPVYTSPVYRVVAEYAETSSAVDEEYIQYINR